MSLKFGIYLVEHKIISPEQFCGLVKIQQESLRSPASVAIQKNMMTIRQISEVLDQQELTPEKTFVEIAIESDYLDRADAEQLIREQQKSSATIRDLVQQCGLLTEQQTNVLFQNFHRTGNQPLPRNIPQEVDDPIGNRADVPEEPSPVGTFPPRPPKFKQRPLYVSQYGHASVDG